MVQQKGWRNDAGRNNPSCVARYRTTKALDMEQGMFVRNPGIIFSLCRTRIKKGVELLERLITSPVNTYMIRKGLALAVLMSLLWPSAPIRWQHQSAFSHTNSHVSPVSGCEVLNKIDSHLGLDQVTLHAAKPWIRRFSLPTAVKDQFGTVSLLANNELHLEDPFYASSRFGFFAVLARSWQFQWRTALSPRAPSLVS